MANIVYGIHPIIETLRSGTIVDKLIVQNNISPITLKKIKEEIRLSKQQVHIQYAPLEKLNALTKNANHQGIVAYTALVEYKEVEEILTEVENKGKQPLFVFLDHITDVRNLGAIARTAECAGVDCLIIPSEHSAQINMDAIKTSAGALLRIPVCKSQNTKTTLNILKQSNIKLVAASEKTNAIYYDCNMKCPICLIMGAEDRGVSKDSLKLADEIVKIPMEGEIESLNVSVAAGILIYETIRQRNN